MPLSLCASYSLALVRIERTQITPVVRAASLNAARFAVFAVCAFDDVAMPIGKVRYTHEVRAEARWRIVDVVPRIEVVSPGIAVHACRRGDRRWGERRRGGRELRLSGRGTEDQRGRWHRSIGCNGGWCVGRRGSGRIGRDRGWRWPGLERSIVRWAGLRQF